MALAALVLSILTLGPGLDGLLCRDDGGMSAVAAEAPLAAQPGADIAPTDDDGRPAPEALSICLHGHCHHAAPYVDASPVSAERSVRLGGVDHAPEPGGPPPSEPTFGLKRPPRA